MNKSILLISSVFMPEPIVSANLTLEIANSFSKNNKVTVLSPRPSRPFGFKMPEKTGEFQFKHIIVNSFVFPKSELIGRFRESYSFGRSCYNYIMDNHQDIDVIYANTWPLFAQYFTVKAARKFKIPVIIHIQDIYPESLINKYYLGSFFIKPVLLPIDKYILRKADQVIVISEKMGEHLIRTRKISNEKVHLIPNWQNEDFFLSFKNSIPVEKSDDAPFTFMYLGNIGPVAGIDLLIDAFTKAKISNCRLIIAGSGSMLEPMKDKAKKTGNSAIDFWSVPCGKVPEIQSLADVLLLPIKKGAALSSIPSKLPAYMLSSKPIVACADANSDTANAIIDANCGWVLPPENIDKLASLMKEIVNLPKQDLNFFGENGHNYALNYYSGKSNLVKLREIFFKQLDK